MAFQFQTPFDVRSVEPSSFAPPPPMDKYHVRIIDGEAKPTNDGTGGYLELTLEILDPGPFQGRHIPYRLNIFSASKQAQEIAYRQMSAVGHVLQQWNLQDVRQLCGIPFIAQIGPQKDSPQYSNVFGVFDINGNAPGKAAQAAPGAFPPAQAPPANAAPPAWGAPPVAPAAPATVPFVAPVWGAPAAPPTAAPAWGPPAGQVAQQPPAAAPAWAPPGQAPSAPAPQWGAQPPAGAPAPPAPSNKPPWG